MAFGKISKLERLLRLKELGVLSDEEFEQRKQLILDAKPVSKLVWALPVAAILLSGVAFGGYTYKQRYDAEKRRQQEAALPIPMVTYKTQTKLMWEWTSGYTFSRQQYGFYVTDNSAEVARACGMQQSTNVTYEESRGWKIVSSNPADKNVQGGSCKGRDIMLEREMPSVTFS
jgi:hypothetical protein